MKKLLALISVVTFTATNAGVLVACGVNNQYNPSQPSKELSLQAINKESLRQINFKIGPIDGAQVVELLSNLLPDNLADKDVIVDLLDNNDELLTISNDAIFQMSKIPGMEWMAYQLQKQSNWLQFDALKRQGITEGNINTDWIPSVDDFALSVSFLNEDKTYWQSNSGVYPSYIRVNLLGKVTLDSNNNVDLDINKTNPRAVRYDQNGNAQSDLNVMDSVYGEISNGWMGGSEPIALSDFYDANYNTIDSSVFNYSPSVVDFHSLGYGISLNDILEKDEYKKIKDNINKFVVNELTNNQSYLSDHTDVDTNIVKLKNPVFGGILFTLMNRNTYLNSKYPDPVDQSKLEIAQNKANGLYKKLLNSVKANISNLQPDDTTFKDQALTKIDDLQTVGTDNDKHSVQDRITLAQDFVNVLNDLYNQTFKDIIGNNAFLLDVRFKKVNDPTQEYSDHGDYAKNEDVLQGNIGLEANEQITLHVFSLTGNDYSGNIEDNIHNTENDDIGAWLTPDNYDSTMYNTHGISLSDNYFKNISTAYRVSLFSQYRTAYNNAVSSWSNGVAKDVQQVSLFDWDSINKNYADGSDDWWRGTDIEDKLGADTSLWTPEKIGMMIDSNVRLLFAMPFDVNNSLGYTTDSLWDMGITSDIPNSASQYSINGTSINGDVYLNDDDIAYDEILLDKGDGVNGNLYATDREQSNPTSSSKSVSYVYEYGLNNYGDRYGNIKPPNPTNDPTQFFKYTIMSKNILPNGEFDASDNLSFNNWVINPDSNKWVSTSNRFTIYVQYQVWTSTPQDSQDPNFANFNALVDLWRDVVGVNAKN